MMSAHRTVPQFGPSRRSPFRFAAAALCTAFVLMAASGCTPMRKQGAVPTFPASTMNDAVEAYQKGDCRESIRRFSAALQQQEHPARQAQQGRQAQREQLVQQARQEP